VSRSRIAVLASGGGSNLQALLDHFRALGDERAGDVVVVASNKSDSGALERARAAGIPVAVLASYRAPDGVALPTLLERYGIDIVVLAGYLQLVPSVVTQRYSGRMLNVHPAPLPAFGGSGMHGMRVHRAVLASGARNSGPTVHFVDEIFDHGATIAHWPVPVLAGDDEHTLASRVLRAEHLLLPRVVQAVTSGAVRLDDHGRVAPPFFRADANLAPLDPALDDASLGLQLDRAMSS
jgi:formyltetrahydrofolate-dependent phosphoribosylglycinamide formyltransferase